MQEYKDTWFGRRSLKSNLFLPHALMLMTIDGLSLP